MSIAVDHEAALKAVLDVVDILQAQPSVSDDDVVRSLRIRGYSLNEAERLNALIPSAFSWVQLRRMGMSEFPNTYLAYDRSGSEIPIPVATDHYFTAALHLAYEALENGWSEVLSRSAFEAVLTRSAAMNAANRALNDGASIEGAQLQPLRIRRLVLEGGDEG